MDNKNIVCALFLGLATLGAGAQEFEAAGLRYNITGDDQVEVTESWIDGASTYHGVVIIPETVNYAGFNYTVTSIAPNAFSRSGVTEVQIPNTVTTIGDAAFAYASSLSSITLPLFLEQVSTDMLAGTAIENIAIPEGVTTIGHGAFQSCTQLHTVMLPSTISTIEAYGFNNCTNLFEIYCAAPTPPKASGWAIFIGLSGIDVVLPDDEAVANYEADAVWGDTETFSLWTNEDVSVSMNIDSTPFGDNWARIDLGNNLAYRIYGEDGEQMALTAAQSYYMPIPDHAATYVVVPTNLINDSDDHFNVTVGTTPVPDIIAPDQEHPIVRGYDGTIYISGDNHGKWTTVYDAYGNLFYQRPSINNIIPDLPRGRVYIVIVGNYVTKVAL